MAGVTRRYVEYAGRVAREREQIKWETGRHVGRMECRMSTLVLGFMVVALMLLSLSGLL